MMDPKVGELEIAVVTESGDTEVETEQDRISLCRKISYGAGGPPMQMCSNCMAFYFTIFVLEVGKLNPFYNSVIQFSARAWDAITDPIVGFLVTKTSTRFGRFRPWLLGSAPFGCLSFFFLFYSPDSDSGTAKFFYYLFMILFLQTALTTFHVPYSSMTMVLTTSMSERDKCSAFRMGFELLGVLVGVGLFGSVVSTGRVKGSVLCNGSVPIETGDNTTVTPEMIEKEKNAYMLGSGLICILFIICAFTAFFGTEERNIPIEKKENYLRSICYIIKFPPYLKLMFAFLFVSLGLQIVQGNMALYISHSVKLDEHMNFGIMALLVTAIGLIPVVQFMVVKLGKKTTFTVGILNLFPILVATVFIPPRPHLALFYGVMIIAGFTISVAYLLPWSMLPDVIDDFMLKRGVRKEAAFYSLYVFFNKFAVGLSMGLSNVVLGFIGYDVEKLCQPPAVGIALRYLVGPTSFVCFIMSLVFLYFYPINEKYREKMRRDLNNLRADQESLGKSNRTLVSNLTNADLTGELNGTVDSNVDQQSHGFSNMHNTNGTRSWFNI